MNGQTSVSFFGNCIYLVHSICPRRCRFDPQRTEVNVDHAPNLVGPLARKNGRTKMFSLFRRKARKAPEAAYQWKPALDLTDPRVSAILLTFGRA